MESIIVLSYLLCVFIGALFAAVISHFVFKKNIADQKQKRKLLHKKEKLDKCVDGLVEFNKKLGAMKGALSNFIAFGGEKYRDKLEESQNDLLDAFKIFYRVEAYLLLMNMQDTHKIMNVYIELVSKLRSDFHYSLDDLKMNDFHESVLRIKACRRRLYSSLNR